MNLLSYVAILCAIAAVPILIYLAKDIRRQWIASRQTRQAQVVSADSFQRARLEYALRISTKGAR